MIGETETSVVTVSSWVLVTAAQACQALGRTLTSPPSGLQGSWAPPGPQSPFSLASIRPPSRRIGMGNWEGITQCIVILMLVQ